MSKLAIMEIFKVLTLPVSEFFLIGGHVSMTSSWGQNIDLVKCLKHVIKLLTNPVLI